MDNNDNELWQWTLFLRNLGGINVFWEHNFAHEIIVIVIRYKICTKTRYNTKNMDYNIETIKIVLSTCLIFHFLSLIFIQQTNAKTFEKVVLGAKGRMSVWYWWWCWCWSVTLIQWYCAFAEKLWIEAIIINNSIVNVLVAILDWDNHSYRANTRGPCSLQT